MAIDKVNILGVQVDKISETDAVSLVEGWLKSKAKHYIVTPNIEFIVDAQSDQEFKKVLNQADLSLADSARLGWATKMLAQPSFLAKLMFLPGFLTPKKYTDAVLSIPGVDFMERLIKEADEKGFTVGFLGGKNMVAEKLSECLQKKYKNLKIVLASDGPIVDSSGEESVEGSKKIHDTCYLIPATDILFVAFGHIKQEKWIAKNLDRIPVKVAMGVGGGFDYLSGQVPRAPKFMRKAGYEWLFRLIIQPWRIKRQLKLLKFIFLLFRSLE